MKGNKLTNFLIIVSFFFGFVSMNTECWAQTNIPIITRPGEQRSPLISGKYIVYTEQHPDSEVPFAYNIETGLDQQIIEGIRPDSFWVSDGNYLVDYWYGHGDIEPPGMAIINLDTNETIATITGQKPDHWKKPYGPQISGNLVVYYEISPDGYIPYIYDISKRQEEELVYDNGNKLGNFEPSAIDKNIIVGMKPAGVGVQEIWAYVLNDQNKVVSGSERFIYKSDINIALNIYIQVAGKNILWKPTACTPDFTCRSSLYLYNLETGETRKLIPWRRNFGGAYPKISEDFIVFRYSDIWAIDLKNYQWILLAGGGLLPDVSHRKVVWGGNDIYGTDLSRFIRGDADGDGTVQGVTTDAIFLLKYLFSGGPKPPCLEAADVDNDGNLTITDATYLLNYNFRGGPAPSAPFPMPGPDPQPFSKSLGCEQSLP